MTYPAWMDDGDAVLYRGDALRVLRELPEASVDGVVTDPPYSSGGLHRSDRNRSTTEKYVQSGTQTVRPEFQGDHRDQRSYLAWCALWLSECARIIKPGRPCLVFTDWRQMPITTDAFQAGGFTWRGIAVWDKGRGTRPNSGFSAQAEYVVWGTLGPNLIGETYVDGVLHSAVRQAEKEHQTGKPLGLIEQLLRVVRPGGIVLDPFAGSGTTLVAARRTGRRSIGIEIEPTYLEVCRARLRQRSLLETVGVGA